MIRAPRPLQYAHESIVPRNNPGLTPFSFFYPTLSAGDMVFAFLAPSKGAVIEFPAIVVGSVSGNVTLSGTINGQLIENTEISAGINQLQDFLELQPFARVEVFLSGAGSLNDVWVTYYARIPV